MLHHPPKSILVSANMPTSNLVTEYAFMPTLNLVKTMQPEVKNSLVSKFRF